MPRGAVSSNVALLAAAAALAPAGSATACPALHLFLIHHLAPCLCAAHCSLGLCVDLHCQPQPTPCCCPASPVQVWSGAGAGRPTVPWQPVRLYAVSLQPNTLSCTIATASVRLYAVSLQPTSVRCTIAPPSVRLHAATLQPSSVSSTIAMHALNALSTFVSFSAVPAEGV